MSSLPRTLAGVAAFGLAALLVAPPDAEAFTVLGFDLGVGARHVRVFDNFTDASANDNVTADPNWPGWTGVELAVWKAVSEWGSGLHGDGSGDPSQPGDVGSGGASFDPVWQGAAPAIGGPDSNVVSAISGLGGGVVSVTEVGPTGWRIRLNDDFLWDDGPGVTLAPGALDVQGILTHEYGNALGLGSSSVPGATMSPALAGNGVALRSIEADDAAGVQFIYGAAPASKPRIAAASGFAPLVIDGSGFAAAGNEVWFTPAAPTLGGVPVVLTGVTSTAGGTRITVNAPAGAGPGDVVVATGSSGSTISNAFPLELPGAPPSTYCTAKTNSQGCVPRIGWTGSPSATAGAGFTIEATLVLNGKPGIFFYGKSGPAAIPFQGGTLCARPPVRRTPLTSSGGNPPPDDCSGVLWIDFNAWIAGGVDPVLTPGQQVNGQFWSRDPAAPSTTNTTDAIEFAIFP